MAPANAHSAGPSADVLVRQANGGDRRRIRPEGPHIDSVDDDAFAGPGYMRNFLLHQMIGIAGHEREMRRCTPSRLSETASNTFCVMRSRKTCSLVPPR